MPATTAKRPAEPAEPVIAVSDGGPCLKNVAIEVPASVVASELEGSYRAFSAQSALPGFRKGHAPRRLIERVFGKAAKDEAKQKLVGAALQKAIQDNKLRVVGDPSAGDDLLSAEITADKPIKVTISVEVAPEFTLPPLDGIPVKKPVYTVSPDEVTEELNRLCVHEGDLEPRDAAEPGDYCTGKGSILDESGKVVLEIDGAVVQIPTAEKGGKGAILGVIVEDFAKQAGLPKPGDTLKIKAKGPAHHETVVIRGKPITMQFEVSRVDRIRPATIEQIVARTGAPSEQALREALTGRLTQRNIVRQQSHMRRQVAEHMLGQTKMELPERLSDKQATRNLERRRLELMYRGFNPVQIEEQVAEMRAASAEAASKELKLFFILDQVARDLDVQASEGELNARIAQMAAERGERPDRLRAEMIQRGQIGMLVQQVREHKAMDALLGKAKIDETAGDAFEKTLEA